MNIKQVFFFLKNKKEFKKDQKEVTITITGMANSGKSGILYLIKETLKEKGINVEFEGDALDFDSTQERDFDLIQGSNFDHKIEVLKSHVKVKIKSVQQYYDTSKAQFVTIVERKWQNINK